MGEHSSIGAKISSHVARASKMVTRVDREAEVWELQQRAEQDMPLLQASEMQVVGGNNSHP